MADHSKPLLTSTYADFVSELDARLDDLATGLDPAVSTVTNQPVNTIRWNSVSKKWQKYNGTAWNDLSGTYDIALQTDRSNFNSVETSVLKSKNATTAMSIADSTGIVTFNANPVLNSGVTNGVVYINGSKVLTSGSALTFDGVRLSAKSLAIADGANGFAQFGSDSSYSIVGGVDNGGFRFNLPSGVDYQFRFNGSEQMRLTSTGLGIGTSSPAGKLHVSGVTNLVASAGSIAVNISGTTPSIGGGQGMVQIYSTDAVAADAGGVLTFNANTTSAANYVMAGIAGKYQTAGAGVYGGYLQFMVTATNGTPTERMRIDSSGNLGLGVVPSAWWSNDKALQVLGGAIWAYNGDTANVNLSANVYQNTSNVATYIGTGTATRYAQETGAHKWYTAPYGTAGSAISFTQAMTLDASGNLGINKTNPTEKLDVNGNIKSSGTIKSESGGFIFPDGTTQTTAATTPTVTAGAVGTYAFLYPASALTLAAGGTAAGSTLRYGPNSTGTSAPSGTWMLMGNLSSSTSASLWYRVS
jgi:hypothetical protein